MNNKAWFRAFCAIAFLAPLAAGADTPINLTGFANRTLDDAATGDGIGGWTDEGPENSLNEFPVGRVEFEGVPFEIPAEGPAVLALKGKSWPDAPTELTIPVQGVRGQAIYVLSAHAWTDGPIEVARMVVTYESGRQDSLPLINLTHTGPWWNPVSLPAAPVVWRGKNRHGVGVGVFLSGHRIADEPLASVTIHASPISGQFLVLGLTVSERAVSSLPKLVPWQLEQRESVESFPLAPPADSAAAPVWEEFAGRSTQVPGRELVMELDAALTAPPEGVAQALARELRALGYTSARLAPLDPLLAWNDPALVRGLLRALDAAGLGASVTLAGGRAYSEEDGVTASRELDPRLGEIFFVEPVATELMHRDLTDFWRDPPARTLASSSIIYDSGLLSYHIEDLTRPHRRMLMNRWAAWLRARHRSQEDLEKAWTVEGQPTPLMPDDNLARSRIELLRLSNILAASPRFRKRIAEQVQFLDEVQREWFLAQREFARRVLPPATWSTTAWSSPSWLRDLQTGLSTCLDVIEERVELSSPSIAPEGGKTPFLEVSPFSKEGLSEFFTPYYRVGGKPFTAWDATGMWPGDRDFLRNLRTMVTAALQGWTGVLHRKLYSIESLPVLQESGSVPGPALQNPAFLATLPLGRHIFLRGDVDVLPILLRRPLMTPEDIVAKLPPVPSLSSPLGANYPSWIPFAAGVEAGIGMAEWRDASLQVEPEMPDPVSSSGGQVSLRPESDLMEIRTRSTMALAGSLEGRSLAVEQANLSVSTGYGVAYMTALDGRPIEESGAILLGLVGRCNNTGTKVERSTEPRGTYPIVWRVADPGTAPILMERVAATFSLPTRGQGAWSVTPLDARGRPVADSAQVSPVNGKLTLQLDNRTHRAPLMLLRRERP